MTTTEKDETGAQAFAPVQATLNEKSVANSFKKAGKVHVQRTEHDLLLTDCICCVRVPSSANVAPFTLPDQWQRATWANSKSAPVEAGPDLETTWSKWEALEVESVLELTHELLEVPGFVKGQPSLFYRKFFAGDRPIYLDKRVMDMLSPDLDELKDFLFERLNGDRGVVRITAMYGHVAYVMTCTLRKI